MTTHPYLDAAIGLIIVAALIASAIYLGDKRTTRRRRVSVTLKDGNAIAGVVWARHLRYYHLKDATYYDGKSQVPLDGDVIVELDNVAFTQLLATTES